MSGAGDGSSSPVQTQATPTTAAPAPTRPGKLVATYAEFFAGPLPHPEVLAKYNDAFRGCAERIVKMAEEQASHRRGLEAKAVQSNIDRERTAQWLAFAAFMSIVAASLYLFGLGRDGTAIGLLAGNLLAFGSAYVYGQRRQGKELAEKQKPFESPPGQKPLPPPE